MTHGKRLVSFTHTISGTLWLTYTKEDQKTLEKNCERQALTNAHHWGLTPTGPVTVTRQYDEQRGRVILHAEVPTSSDMYITG